MLDLVWLIPALPLAGFGILVVGGRKLGEPLAGWLATAMMGGSFLATLVVFSGLFAEDDHHRVFTQTLFTWLPVGGLEVGFGFLVDPLSITMALFVTGIGTLIHLYSVGYMHGDPKFSKFFVYLNLFGFSMLMLVLGDNLLITFLGWEGVGACSYFLISFWFSDEANASAGKKAFVTNRIGDWGFMVAMFLMFATVGTLTYTQFFESFEAGEVAAVTATAITLLLFVGACGKSAQLPLFVWLPDAMAGPTPVSALIHAATMVTSGVYLMTRMNPVIASAYDWAPDIIAWVGVLTALFAATIAMAQNDIKKVLAYSTVSQLGYMFLAVGTGAYVAAIFHMVTHAFFKALLFLGSGSVIHGMHGEQDMQKMGGLRKYMPITASTFIVGWLAIAGVPPFAGFWSKDEILLYAFGSGGVQGYALYTLGLVTAVLTAYYMSRQVFLVFFGEERFRDVEHAAEEDEAEAGEHESIEPHESPWTMTMPLVVLAGLAMVGGGLNLAVSDRMKFLEHWLEPVVEVGEATIDVETTTTIGLAVVAVAAAAVGIFYAYRVFIKKRSKAIEPELLAHAWHYDEAVSAFVDKPGRKAFQLTADFDEGIVDGAVNGVGSLVGTVGRQARKLQSGFVRAYAAGIAAGAVLLLAYFLNRVAS
ncbi:MAG TPA: NADH-quinone oxidoreductase subunit L [Acidimicrobiales bacterium]|nr:NADH-quinone oxidoreductase subunit L [Acidimicrobiales bacterium]